MFVEERHEASTSIQGGCLVVPRAGDASKEAQEQGLVLRCVVVHEPMANFRVDLDVMGHLELGQELVQPPSGTGAQGDLSAPPKLPTTGQARGNQSLASAGQPP